MKTNLKFKITLSKNFKDSKFSYPKIKKNKEKQIKREEINSDNKENIQHNSNDFWEDCKK